MAKTHDKGEVRHLLLVKLPCNTYIAPKVGTLLSSSIYPQFPEGVIFQQDGAPPHYGNIVREFLDATFRQRWTGRGAVIAGHHDPRT
ncbi:hypothetical protein AVEN_92300-1 [Araneus ventricosus]|uniref:Tc1-like transposase DDE domain-containing protein n=1 Tax=Araneus ventricosus TaxID=182803 RepID=A0A4Y2AKW7_ARAVE|nr:hypothetical protein AVEN_92300-1 [Araneus ventricosus]